MRKRAGMKVAEVAARTGVTVRTLHHYDEVDLLSPSGHTESGHRLYNEEDITRLQQILSLRALGFSLDEIAEFLARRGVSPLDVVELHLASVRAQLDRTQRLCHELEAVAAKLRSRENPSLEELLRTIEVIIMFEKYLTPEQTSQVLDRGRALGKDFVALFAEVREEMAKGTAPSTPRVQELARRFHDLVRAFVGTDPGIAQGLSTVQRESPDIFSKWAGAHWDAALCDYLIRAGAQPVRSGSTGQ